jgi:hypothetical protein
MNETVENLVLVQLSEMRAEIAAMRGEMGEMHTEIGALRDDMKDGLAEVNGRVDGRTMMIRLSATHTEHLDSRVEKIEERVR